MDCYDEDGAEDTRPMRRLRVWLHSTPGHYAQYDGHVDVTTREDNAYGIFMAAVRELRRTSFPDRDAGCWKLERYEAIG